MLGRWLGAHDNAKFWLSVLQDLQQRGADILIAVVDGRSGFRVALETAFPATTVQTCIVHLLHDSLSCASYRERSTLAAALKPIYTAINADAAAALDAFEASELGQRFQDVVRLWLRSWERVIPFLAFSLELRKLIYTTNAIESLNA